MKFAFVLSLFLHLMILVFLLFEFKDKTQNLGGLNAKKGEFQSLKQNKTSKMQIYEQVRMKFHKKTNKARQI